MASSGHHVRYLLHGDGKRRHLPRDYLCRQVELRCRYRVQDLSTSNSKWYKLVKIDTESYSADTLEHRHDMPDPKSPPTWQAWDAAPVSLSYSGTTSPMQRSHTQGQMVRSPRAKQVVIGQHKAWVRDRACQKRGSKRGSCYSCSRLVDAHV